MNHNTPSLFDDLDGMCDPDRSFTNITDLPPGAHRWVIAANVPVDDARAKSGFRLGNIRVTGNVDFKVDVLEVSCAACRRCYEDVADAPCTARAESEMLRGGPIGTRAKRRPDRRQSFDPRGIRPLGYREHAATRGPLSPGVIDGGRGRAV